ncbi:MAG: cation transporter [Bacteroidota bacterium]
MKTKILSVMAILGLSISTIMANAEKKEKFEVAGNCGMCKTRIEKAANSVDGVSAAEWEKESKMLDVTFDPDKADLHKVHMAVAKAGHDTKMHQTSDEVYDKLPGCCKYDRLEKESAGCC